jgi:hypothetical protein
MVSAVLITQPAIDFNTLISNAHKALGYSIAASSDASKKQQNDVERFLSCLAAMRDQAAPTGLSPNLLCHVSFSALIAADELDTLEILECASGMPFVSTETVARGIQLTVLTGTLAQWRDAVISGTRRGGAVQAMYCQIESQFEAHNLNVWTDFNKRWSDKVFLLEDKRR